MSSREVKDTATRKKRRIKGESRSSSPDSAKKSRADSKTGESKQVRLNISTGLLTPPPPPHTHTHTHARTHAQTHALLLFVDTLALLYLRVEPWYDPT